MLLLEITLGSRYSITLLCVIVILSTMRTPVYAAKIDALEGVDCVIYPSQEADIGSDSLGVLESLLVDRSEFVKKGDIIAQLESSAEQAAVALATARAHAAAEVNFRQLSADHSKRQYTRIEQLARQSTVSAKDLDDRKTEFQLGEQQLRKAVENKHILDLELARAKVNLEKRTIRSPFSGVVVEKYKSVGEYIDSDPIVRIVQLHPLHIETIIPAEHVGEIQPGMRAQIISADNHNKRWTARVDRVDSVIDVASATFGVLLELPNPDFAITAGLRCQLSFIDDEMHASSTTTQANSTSSTPALAAAAMPINDIQSDKKQPGDERVADQTHGNRRDDSAVGVKSSIEPAKPIACINEGPFSDRAMAEKQAGEWTQRGNTIEIVSKSVREKQGYLVKSPVFESRDDAKAYLSSLETIGITDSFLPSKTTPVRVSIGAFRQRDAATSRMTQLSVNGINAEILPWEKSHQEFYLVGHSGHSTAGAHCQSSVSAQ